MVFFPNCKINLGLRILRKRPDGYHDLETIFYPLPLKDVLEIIYPDPAGTATTTPAPTVSTNQADETGGFRLHLSGLPIPGDPAKNLCVRAWELLKKDFPRIAPVNAWLHKNIPMGSGLGGGSADGAAMLQLLDRSFGLGLGRERLLEYAAMLGSDCPFFILNKPCLGRGRGEELEPIELDLSAYSFVLVHPGISVSTARAFSQVSPGVPAGSLAAIIRRPIGTWAGELVNDFEAPLLGQYPELTQIKEKLYVNGALYASLTGSGSSFFGIFEKGKAPSLKFEQDFRVNILE
jgi:4-diphosphocytidyl-2-C-methyl-D-erythritol kinase